MSNVVDKLRDALYTLDENWCFTYLNPAAEKLLLRTKEELLQKSVWDEFIEVQVLHKMFYKAAETKSEVEFETYYEPLKTWFDVRAYPFEKGIAVQFRDINRRKKALEESREHHRSLFEHNPDAVFSFDLEGNYLSVNKSFEKLLGYTMNEYLSMNFDPLVVPEDLEKASFYFNLAAEGNPQEYEVACLTKTGERIEVSVINVPIIVGGAIVGVYGIAKDITQTKRVEQEMKEREASLNLALHIAKLGSWTWDLIEDKIIWSEELYQIFGVETNLEITLETLLQYVHPEDRLYMKNAIEDALKGKPFYINYRIIRSNGELRYIEALGELFYDDNKKPVKFIGTTQDVTERKLEQEKLKRSKELYNLISENSQDIIIFTDQCGIIQYVSPAIEPVLGYKSDDLLGNVREDIIHQDDLSHFKQIYKKEKEVSVIRVLHKNGHYVWIEASIKFITNENAKDEKVLIIARDITERVEAKELMVKSEKLSMAGQLAAGIAHEIRNPLTAIKGFLNLMQNGFNMEKEYLDVMDSELVRIEFILNELLLLAKPTKHSFENKDINSVVLHVVKLLETEANLKNILFKTELHNDEIYINCDENQLKQIFINFIKNGIEAMPTGGLMTINTYLEKNHVVIDIKDEGCGIPKEKLINIGQPFFTTKEKGTGLGLAVSFSIIENHKGEIDIDSEEGKGTSIYVKFPLVHEIVIG
ncbi:PAS domain S-box protein [Bacillus luteolus]|uniref:histidine kinase n=2 Tax=Litchfieldia luteola TaxID=682179 RepID=A0ABR9QEE3_9BACI|nr:PAS domain S-box protein [Cytobacillus luteolus]MBE4906866.1 PAS domain S-box protein [Cytobacillus luteolus]MBP1940479.1 two-component system sporulation sensor kinase A [Cytobacillus luteolus]